MFPLISAPFWKENEKGLLFIKTGRSRAAAMFSAVGFAEQSKRQLKRMMARRMLDEGQLFCLRFLVTFSFF